MIVGIGIDLVEIDRIRKLIQRFGTNFIAKVFTVNEQQEAAMRRDPATYYAGRWAVKEAVSKALGCGIGSKCALLEVESCNTPSGRPEVHLSGNAHHTYHAIGGRRIWLSVTHEASYAIANVTIEH